MLYVLEPDLIDFTQFALLALAVCLTGLSKGGFAGLGMISTPLLATVMDPLLAVAVMLPILLVQDAIALLTFRRSVDWAVLRRMLPGALLGIALGWLLAAHVSTEAVTFAIGVIASGSAVFFLFRPKFTWRGERCPAAWLGTVCGAASGFASLIAHAGPPPFQIYVIPLKLQREYFVGTSVWFFAFVNTLKIGPYAALGNFSSTSLTISILAIPISLLATLAGIVLVRLCDPDRFFKLILVLLGAVGVRLIWDGGRNLFFTF